MSFATWHKASPARGRRNIIAELYLYLRICVFKNYYSYQRRKRPTP